MRRSRRVLVMLGLLLVAVVVVIVREHRLGQRLSQELATRRRQGLEFASLQSENRELVARQVSAEELERLRRTMSEIEGKKFQGGGRTSPPPSAVVHPDMIPATDWKFAGRTTPKATFESVLWTATHQDVDHLAALLAFDSKTREKADAFFAQLPDETRAQYGSPEKIAATMLAATLPDNLSAMGSLLGADNDPSGDTARLLMQVQRSDGAKRDTFFEFHRNAEGWQLLVPPDVLSSYQRQLTNPVSGGKEAQDP
jgi:hypothetical protein